jgi:hypothetical protein
MRFALLGKSAHPTILNRQRAALPYRRINRQFSHGLSLELTDDKSPAALTANHPGSK